MWVSHTTADGGAKVNYRLRRVAGLAGGLQLLNRFLMKWFQSGPQVRLENLHLLPDRLEWPVGAQSASQHRPEHLDQPLDS